MFILLAEAFEPVVDNGYTTESSYDGYLPSQTALPMPLNRYEYSLTTTLRTEG